MCIYNIYIIFGNHLNFSQNSFAFFCKIQDSYMKYDYNYAICKRTPCFFALLFYRFLLYNFSLKTASRYLAKISLPSWERAQ